ncbi:MAG: DivIVA domain-containing protein [bacterium]
MDETFHLTPLDVRRYDFGKALRGYNPERVEQFRDQVAEELERLTRQTLDLEQKAKGFHEQLRAFRERDKAMNDALVSAQQLRNEIRESSEREAALIVREARTDAEREIEGARNEIRNLEAHLQELERARRSHLTQMRMAVERHLAEITAAENVPSPHFPVLPRVSNVDEHPSDDETRMPVGSAERE